jgi:hypothetical protein
VSGVGTRFISRVVPESALVLAERLIEAPDWAFKRLVPRQRSEIETAPIVAA